MTLPPEVMEVAEKRNGRVVKPGVIGRFGEGTARLLAEEIGEEAGLWCDVVPLGNRQWGVSVMGYEDPDAPGDPDDAGVPA